MQINQNQQWVEMVAKLTLVRSILGTVTADIDNLVSESHAGHSNLSDQQTRILENLVNDLTSISESVGDAAVDIPDVLLQLNWQPGQQSSQSQGLKDCNPIFKHSLFDLGEFTTLDRQVS